MFNRTCFWRWTSLSDWHLLVVSKRKRRFWNTKRKSYFNMTLFWGRASGVRLRLAFSIFQNRMCLCGHQKQASIWQRGFSHKIMSYWTRLDFDIQEQQYKAHIIRAKMYVEKKSDFWNERKRRSKSLFRDKKSRFLRKHLQERWTSRKWLSFQNKKTKDEPKLIWFQYGQKSRKRIPKSAVFWWNVFWLV